MLSHDELITLWATLHCSVAKTNVIKARVEQARLAWQQAQEEIKAADQRYERIAGLHNDQAIEENVLTEAHTNLQIARLNAKMKEWDITALQAELESACVRRAAATVAYRKLTDKLLPSEKETIVQLAQMMGRTAEWETE